VIINLSSICVQNKTMFTIRIIPRATRKGVPPLILGYKQIIAKIADDLLEYGTLNSDQVKIIVDEITGEE
jgi:polyhydroxyalkanoate synthesis regulator phasin